MRTGRADDTGVHDFWAEYDYRFGKLCHCRAKVNITHAFSYFFFHSFIERHEAD